MCGIFGYIGSKQNAAELVFDGLKKLEYRGYDSWGVAAVLEDRKQKTEKLQLRNILERLGMRP